MLVNFDHNLINNFNTPKLANNRVSYQNLAPLKHDTVCFKSKFVRPKDLMDLPRKDILKICTDAIKNDIEVGRGQEATVYKIPQYAREYCIRVERKGSEALNKLKLDFNLNDFDEANFVVAKLGKGITLLRYISGVPLKIMRKSDTPSGIKVKESLQELIANNFPEESFIKVINQIEANRSKGIIFDRKGENLLVDPMIQELTAIDFSPQFNDIEYNPISYIYHALDVDNTQHALKVFGKLCNAYAERLKTADIKELNLDVLDKNFYHRGFMEEPFNHFPDRELLEEIRVKLFEELLEAKKTKTSEEFDLLADEFKEFIEDRVMNYRKPLYDFD